MPTPGLGLCSDTVHPKHSSFAPFMIFHRSSKLHVPAHGAALLSLPTSLVFKSKIGQRGGGRVGRMPREMLRGYRRIPAWIFGKLVQASSSRLAASSVPSVSSQVSAALCQTLSSLPCLFSASSHPPSAPSHWNQGRCRCLPARLPPPPTSPDLSKSLDFSKRSFLFIKCS